MLKSADLYYADSHILRTRWTRQCRVRFVPEGKPRSPFYDGAIPQAAQWWTKEPKESGDLVKRLHWIVGYVYFVSPFRGHSAVLVTGGKKSLESWGEPHTQKEIHRRAICHLSLYKSCSLIVKMKILNQWFKWAHEWVSYERDDSRRARRSRDYFEIKGRVWETAMDSYYQCTR